MAGGCGSGMRDAVVLFSFADLALHALSVTCAVCDVCVADLFPDTLITVDNIPVLNLTVTNATAFSSSSSSGNTRRMLLQSSSSESNFTRGTAMVAQFMTPVINESSYFDVVIVNPDGGYYVFEDAVYYTMDCPMVGTLPVSHPRCCHPAALCQHLTRRGERVHRLDWAGFVVSAVSSGCLLPRRQPHLAPAWLVPSLCSLRHPPHTHAFGVGPLTHACVFGDFRLSMCVCPIAQVDLQRIQRPGVPMRVPGHRALPGRPLCRMWRRLHGGFLRAV